MLALLLIYGLIITVLSIVAAFIIIGLLLLVCWIYDFIDNLKDRE